MEGGRTRDVAFAAAGAGAAYALFQTTAIADAVVAASSFETPGACAGAAISTAAVGGGAAVDVHRPIARKLFRNPSSMAADGGRTVTRVTPLTEMLDRTSSGSNASSASGGGNTIIRRVSSLSGAPSRMLSAPSSMRPQRSASSSSAWGCITAEQLGSTPLFAAMVKATEKAAAESTADPVRWGCTLSVGDLIDLNVCSPAVSLASVNLRHLTVGMEVVIAPRNTSLAKSAVKGALVAWKDANHDMHGSIRNISDIDADDLASRQAVVKIDQGIETVRARIEAQKLVVQELEDTKASKNELFAATSELHALRKVFEENNDAVVLPGETTVFTGSTSGKHQLVFFNELQAGESDMPRNNGDDADTWVQGRIIRCASDKGAGEGKMTGGAEVELTENYEEISDASGGPLRPGMIGVITQDDSDNENDDDNEQRYFHVQAPDGDTWYYMRGAIRALTKVKAAIDTTAMMTIVVEVVDEAQIPGSAPKEFYRKVKGEYDSSPTLNPIQFNIKCAASSLATTVQPAGNCRPRWEAADTAADDGVSVQVEQVQGLLVSDAAGTPLFMPWKSSRPEREWVLGEVEAIVPAVFGETTSALVVTVPEFTPSEIDEDTRTIYLYNFDPQPSSEMQQELAIRCKQFDVEKGCMVLVLF
jgi:hypothetical protein